MPEHASTECQQRCSVISGSVYDVCSFEGDNGVVYLVDRSDNPTSLPLVDLGEANGHYLIGVRKCVLPGKGRFFGLGRADCVSQIGEHNLKDYVIES